MAPPSLFLGLDIGGTKMGAGVVDGMGRLASALFRRTPASSPGAILEGLAGMAWQALEKAGESREGLAGVGISFGGPVHHPSGTTITCHHLPGWEGVPLRQMGEDMFRLPVAMDNDANAAALAEALWGAGRGHTHLLFLTVSSGIGGGIIREGEVERGAGSLAGEIGHVVLRRGGPKCTCGKRGCLEALSSGWSIGKAATRRLRRWEGESLLREMAGPWGEVTAEMVARGAALGDGLACQVWRQALEHLGLAISAAANLLNPSLVIVGGGVAKAGEVFFAPLREAVARYGVAEVPVVPAGLGEEVGIMGGAALALKQREERCQG